MPTTSNYELRYPSLAVAPDVPQVVGDLAADVDAALTAMAASVATPPAQGKAWRTAALTVLNGVPKLVPFDADGHGMTLAMHDPSTNNSRVYLPTAGTWLVKVKARFNADASGFRTAEVRSNAAGVVSGGASEFDGYNPGVSASLGTDVWAEDLVESDGTKYLELFLAHNSAGNPSGTGGETKLWMRAQFLGDLA